ncbi:hypothetical protein BaRGS_00005157 [Batillaria attramentaria]|uniref:Uncharacterized protein n=1 Tax=Batillaria attramentaria TaxID=370345 RepID=A0ABD0LW47_9CAEN
MRKPAPSVSRHAQAGTKPTEPEAEPPFCSTGVYHTAHITQLSVSDTVILIEAWPDSRLDLTVNQSPSSYSQSLNRIPITEYAKSTTFCPVQVSTARAPARSRGPLIEPPSLQALALEKLYKTIPLKSVNSQICGASTLCRFLSPCRQRVDSLNTEPRVCDRSVMFIASHFFFFTPAGWVATPSGRINIICGKHQTWHRHRTEPRGTNDRIFARSNSPHQKPRHASPSPKTEWGPRGSHLMIHQHFDDQVSSTAQN